MVIKNGTDRSPLPTVGKFFVIVGSDFLIVPFCVTIVLQNKNRNKIMKTAIINARIEPELKSQVENILKEVGLNATQAITLFYKQVLLNNGIPFDIKIPNDETQKAIEDARQNKNMHLTTLEDLRKYL
jgi:DNA-damage-inducible protein J